MTATADSRRRDRPPAPSEPFQMPMIHRTFTAEFGNLAALTQGLPAGDVPRARFVSNYLSNLISVLHHHHLAEDELLWPKLADRAGSSRETLDRVGAEHTVIDDAIGAVQAARALWAERAEPVPAQRLGAALTELSELARSHFEHEERDVVPLIEEHICASEWQAFIDRGAAYVTPKNLWFSLAYSGVLLAAAKPDERDRFMVALPLPLRTVVRVLGRHVYHRYRKRLYG